MNGTNFLLKSSKDSEFEFDRKSDRFDGLNWDGGEYPRQTMKASMLELRLLRGLQEETWVKRGWIWL